MTALADCEARDAADPLAHFRDRFALPEGVIYLDGNSLGALPRATAGHVARVIEAEWGTGLVRSWNEADWYGAPQRVRPRWSCSRTSTTAPASGTTWPRSTAP